MNEIVFGKEFNGVMTRCATSGNLDAIKFLHEKNVKTEPMAMDIAAEKGNLEMVKWFHDNRNEGCTTDAMNSAAKYGHLHVVKWLHENRTEGCTEKAMDWASDLGHLHVVKWLHENRTEGCGSAILSAYMSEHIEVANWLNENRPDSYDNLTIKEKNRIRHWLTMRNKETKKTKKN